MKMPTVCTPFLFYLWKSGEWLRVMGARVDCCWRHFRTAPIEKLSKWMVSYLGVFQYPWLRLKGLARIWTAIAGFRVQSANRYTTRPDIWKSLFALCGLKKANILLSVRLSNCFHLLVESARALMILRMIWPEPIFCNRICLKFRHRDSNPGRSGESRVS